LGALGHTVIPEEPLWSDYQGPSRLTDLDARYGATCQQFLKLISSPYSRIVDGNDRQIAEVADADNQRFAGGCGLGWDINAGVQTGALNISIPDTALRLRVDLVPGHLFWVGLGPLERAVLGRRW